MLSPVSNSGKNVVQEAADPNGSVLASPLCKHTRHGSSVTPVKFKGVFQQNGHWGAQIYAIHRRVWLGTFKSEKDAAMAYDSAAIRLRSGDSHRNFPWTRATMEEPIFQNLYSSEALLSMIKDGSYAAKFEDFLRIRFQIWGKEVSSDDIDRIQNQGGLHYTKLFEKVLTPSDVGKFSRLVIPKKYAVIYFPRIAETTEENWEGGQEGKVQLVFYDRLMRSWKFRYCYWKSSQAYVFTKGWNHFVKDKRLKSNDTIAFFLCKSREGTTEAVHFLMINVKEEGNDGLLRATKQYVGLSSDSMLRLDEEMVQENEGKKLEANEGEAVEATPKGFKLFGVQIEQVSSQC